MVKIGGIRLLILKINWDFKGVEIHPLLLILTFLDAPRIISSFIISHFIKGGQIKLEEVFEYMSIDENEIETALDDHGKRIQRLEVDMAGVKEKLNSVEGIVTRFETNYYQTSNSMLQTMSQLVVNTSNNNTEITKTKSNNRKDIIIKVLGILGALIVGFIGAKYGISITTP